MILLKKSMIQSKNLKLKLGLCGLALTSFLALNAHSTVHADTVSGDNAGAITWDSDQDDSQVVKEESQRDNSSQSAQKQATVRSNAQVKQASATQNVQTQGAVQEQKAPATQPVQPAQKQVTVQSNVQVKQFQPKVAVASVSSTPVQQKRAETSNLRQSNVQTSTVNRLNANNHVAKVDVASANKPVQITNPQNNRIVVHYVKTNGQSAGLADQTITLSKSGNGYYNLPSGYQLAISSGPYNVQADRHIVHHDAVTKPVTSVVKDANNQDIHSIIYDEIGHHGEIVDHGTMGDTGNIMSGGYALERQVRAHGSEIENGDYITYDGYDDSNTSGEYYPTGYKYYKAGSNTPLYHVYDPNRPDSYCSDVPVWLSDYMIDWRITGGAYPRLVLSATSKTETKNVTIPAYDETVGNNIFTDNSGNIKSVAGNVVNVVVTKPASVDPNSANCKRQAQRVIHVAFPNGVKPKSYDSITDSAGNKLTLDSNNDLTQTVTFTRTKTVDSLTGATLNQTPWQQHGAINAVTLPAIPGYTMVTNTK